MQRLHCIINGMAIGRVYDRKSEMKKGINAFNYNVFSMSIMFDVHCCSF